MQSESRIEAKLTTGLFDRHAAIVVGDVVDTGPTAVERQHGGLRGGVDVDGRLWARLTVPSAWTVEETVAERDALHTGLQNLPLHVGSATYRLDPRPVGEIERIILAVRFASRCVGKCNAL